MCKKGKDSTGETVSPLYCVKETLLSPGVKLPEPIEDNLWHILQTPLSGDVL